MKEGKSKVIKRKNKVWIYIPILVSSDSAFPFKKGDMVKIRIVDDKLVVEKEEDKK